MRKILSYLLCFALTLGTFSVFAETLTGEAQGFNGPITVTVTLEDGKIVSVEALGDDETEGIGTPALTEIPAKIVASNSADVDVLSGATWTSEGVINAVKDALAGAGAMVLTGEAKGFNGPITVTVTLEEGKIVMVEAMGPDETEGIGTPALLEIPMRLVENNSADVDVLSGATWTSEGVINAVKDALASANAVTLTGEAKGFNGPITVSVTLEDGIIVKVEAMGPDETEGIGTPALLEIPMRIVQNNSADVDVLSGATWTSEGVINAVKDALDNEAGQ